jgi:hypothetical protein
VLVAYEEPRKQSVEDARLAGLLLDVAVLLLEDGGDLVEPLERLRDRSSGRARLVDPGQRPDQVAPGSFVPASAPRIVPAVTR